MINDSALVTRYADQFVRIISWGLEKREISSLLHSFHFFIYSVHVFCETVFFSAAREKHMFGKNEPTPLQFFSLINAVGQTQMSRDRRAWM